MIKPRDKGGGNTNLIVCEIAGIEACLKDNCWRNEEPFEIIGDAVGTGGPHRGRLRKQNKVSILSLRFSSSTASFPFAITSHLLFFFILASALVPLLRTVLVWAIQSP